MHEGVWSQRDLLMDWMWGMREGSGMTLGLLPCATGRLARDAIHQGEEDWGMRAGSQPWSCWVCAAHLTWKGCRQAVP